MQAGKTRAQVRRVLVIILILNLIVASAKIVVGALSGVLAISADGVHSLIDGSSNLIALVANALAARPPDEDHPYGHRRFETLAALLIGGFLLLTAWEIVTSAIERLQSGAEHDIQPLTIGVLVGTLVVNLIVSRYERAEGQRLQSELLLADAENTGADVFVTISVLISTVLVAVFGWAWADPLAAIVIVILIVRAGWNVIRETGDVLVDRAPYRAGEIRALVETVPNVREVVRVRSRGPADAATVDVDVRVAPAMTADHTAALTRAIKDTLTGQLPGLAEVEVHFAPDYDEAPDYALAARARADALGLTTHEVRVSSGPNGKIMEMHVEVPPGQTLGAAHEQVTQLEQTLITSLPDVADVVTHIEPAFDSAGGTVGRCSSDVAGRVRQQAEALLNMHYPHEDWHDLDVTPLDGGYALTLHVTLPPDITVEAAHQRAEAMEMLLRGEIDGLQRATIHTEPPEA